MTISCDDTARRVELRVSEEALLQDSKLDGCYVLKTDLQPDQADKYMVNECYKDMSQVDSAFRTSKTVELELRRINVRLASRTRKCSWSCWLAGSCANWPAAGAFSPPLLRAPTNCQRSASPRSSTTTVLSARKSPCPANPSRSSWRQPTPFYRRCCPAKGPV